MAAAPDTDESHLARVDRIAIARLRAAADRDGTIRVQYRRGIGRSVDERIPIDQAVTALIDALRPVPGFVGGGGWQFSTRSDGAEWIAVEDHVGATRFYELARP